MQNANDELWLYDQSAKLHHTQKHERYTDIYIHTYIYIYTNMYVGLCTYSLRITVILSIHYLTLYNLHEKSYTNLEVALL